MSHICGVQVPDISDSETISIRHFSGVDDLIHFIQLRVEAHEIEVRVGRKFEGCDDVSMVIVREEFTEAEVFHAFTKDGTVLLISAKKE